MNLISKKAVKWDGWELPLAIPLLSKVTKLVLFKFEKPSTDVQE